jgi:hypothetical protein
MRKQISPSRRCNSTVKAVPKTPRPPQAATASRNARITSLRLKNGDVVKSEFMICSYHTKEQTATKNREPIG